MRRLYVRNNLTRWRESVVVRHPCGLLSRSYSTDGEGDGGGEAAVQRSQTRHASNSGSTVSSLGDADSFTYRIAVKDNFVSGKLPTTCGSAMLWQFTGDRPSKVCELLQKAGLEVTHKTNMDEFGMGSHSTNSHYGPVKNGRGDLAQSVGGSSGGSALLVANGSFSTAIGSDTGGSIRLPAAYTNTFGFKPSYGRISRRGLVPYANSLDTVGLIGASVEAIRPVFNLLDQYDPEDPTSLSPQSRQRIQDTRRNRFWATNTKRSADDPPVRSVFSKQNLSQERVDARRGQGPDAADHDLPFKGSHARSVGFPVEYNIAELHPTVRAAWQRALSYLKAQGHTVRPISLPSTKLALPAYYVLAPAEASSNLAKYDGVRYGHLRPAQFDQTPSSTLYSEYRGTFFGDEVRNRILLGTFSLSSSSFDNYFLQAQRVRRLIQKEFNSVFALPHPLLDQSQETSQNGTDRVDFIVTPTAPTPPPLLSTVSQMSETDHFMNDIFTVPASLAGLPAISMPASVFGLAVEEQKADSAGATKAHRPEKNIGIQIMAQYGDDAGLMTFAGKIDNTFDPESPVMQVFGDRAWSTKNSVHRV